MKKGYSGQLNGIHKQMIELVLKLSYNDQSRINLGEHNSLRTFRQESIGMEEGPFQVKVRWFQYHYVSSGRRRSSVGLLLYIGIELPSFEDLYLR